MRVPYTMVCTPDRPNITKQVEKVKGDISCLNWLEDMLDAYTVTLVRRQLFTAEAIRISQLFTGICCVSLVQMEQS